MMEKTVHTVAQVVQDVTTIVVHLHVFALFVINITKTPKSSPVVRQIYRGLELFAGLLTPLAKR